MNERAPRDASERIHECPLVCYNNLLGDFQAKVKVRLNNSSSPFVIGEEKNEKSLHKKKLASLRFFSSKKGHMTYEHNIILCSILILGVIYIVSESDN